MDKYIQSNRERFAQVMAARKTARELIGLVEKLADSDKFSIPAKPYCFADLVQVCAVRVPDSLLDDLLEAIDYVWVGSTIRVAHSPEATDMVVRGLVRRVLEATSKDDALERRLRKMRAGGLIRNEAHALELAVADGLPKAVEARASSALSRLAARPKVDEPCPF